MRTLPSARFGQPSDVYCEERRVDTITGKQQSRPLSAGQEHSPPAPSWTAVASNAANVADPLPGSRCSTLVTKDQPAAERLRAQRVVATPHCAAVVAFASTSGGAARTR